MNAQELMSLPVARYAGYGVVAMIAAIVGMRTLKSVATSWYGLLDRRITHLGIRQQYRNTLPAKPVKQKKVDPTQEMVAQMSAMFLRLATGNTPANQSQPDKGIPPGRKYLSGDIIRFRGNRHMSQINSQNVKIGDVGTVQSVHEFCVIMNNGNNAYFEDIEFVSRPN